MESSRNYSGIYSRNFCWNSFRGFPKKSFRWRGLFSFSRYSSRDFHKKTLSFGNFLSNTFEKFSRTFVFKKKNQQNFPPYLKKLYIKIIETFLLRYLQELPKTHQRCPSEISSGKLLKKFLKKRIQKIFMKFFEESFQRYLREFLQVFLKGLKKCQTKSMEKFCWG